MKTIISKLFVDEAGQEYLQYFYADITIENETAIFSIDTRKPLSEDEVIEFNKDSNGKIMD